MANITTENTTHREFTSATPIEPVDPTSEVHTVESERFAKLVDQEENENLDPDLDNSNQTPTLEDMRREFMESSFKSGFNRTMDRAKEIIKEMKS